MSPPQTQTPLPDAEARRQIAEELEETFFVEAAAGTGKTTALVQRVVSVLRRGVAELECVVAMTFTEKAAGEMKLRLRSEIERVRGAADTPPEERARLDASLAQLEVARIGTIHSFCADLLHERPIEAGVDPLFEVIGDEDADALLAQSFDHWFERVLEDPPEGVRRVLRRRAAGPNAQTPRDSLRAAVRTLIEHRDFEAPWRRDVCDREAALDALMERLAGVGALVGLASREDDYLTRSLDEIDRFCDEIRLQEAVRGRDYDSLEAALRTQLRVRHWNWVGFRSKQFSAKLLKADVVAQRDAAKAELDRVLAECEAQLAPLLREELREVVAAYEVAKQRAGRLDFLDLLVRTRDLVRDDASVRAELQARFSHFFVDEMQDTDPLQAEILLLLTAADPQARDARSIVPLPGKLFLVGDPKQSIYRFRRADVSLYAALKQRLCAHGAKPLTLNASFRSRPEIQGLVNAAFEQAMVPEPGFEADAKQADYVPLAAVRESPGAQPSLVALPVPRPYGDYGKIVNFRIDDSLPDAVGAFIAWLVDESGWQVEDRVRDEAGALRSELVPVAPRHICVLFRRMKRFRDDVTRPYVRALEARRVPHVLIGGRSFHEREEVLALRNALHAIEWPDDPLRVFATLRGPLFALGDDALLAFRTRFGSLHPMRRYVPDEAPEEEAGSEGESPAAPAAGASSADEQAVATALGLLARLHAGRNRRAVAETLIELLGELRAHAGLAIWPTGEQALANCSRVIDQARRFEARGGSSFRAFVERLELQAAEGSSQDAAVVEEGTEGVRMMTVHKAKGLEFPVVILADPTCRATNDRASRHVDIERGLFAEPLCGCAPAELAENAELENLRDREEAVRLTYVAATRARDLLVVPVVGDEDEAVQENPGWLDVLRPAVYPRSEERRNASIAPACPNFGEDSVFERPGRAPRSAEASVRPGLHRPTLGTEPIVWWDPSALALDVREDVGLRQQRILEADEDASAAQGGAAAHAAWQARRRAAREAGARPSFELHSATELAERDAARIDTTRGVELHEVEGRGERPHGKRFGTLVHAALAVVAVDAGAAEVEAAVGLQARIVDASEEERSAAVAAVTSALAHPLLVRAAASEDMRREAPVTYERADGAFVEGVVDLAFSETDGDGQTSWVVVDFKTDRDLGERRPSYEAQLRLYAEAIEAATEQSARPILLVV